MAVVMGHTVGRTAVINQCGFGLAGLTGSTVDRCHKYRRQDR